MTTPTVIAPFTLTDLEAIIDDTWTAYLADPDGDRSPEPAVDEPDRQVTAAISITGAWDGHVVLKYSKRLAGKIAATLLSLPADEVTPADLVDSAGELANVIGGNVKGLLPQPTAMSLPRVTIGRPDSSYWPHTFALHTATASWRDEAVTVLVLQVQIR